MQELSRDRREGLGEIRRQEDSRVDPSERQDEEEERRGEERRQRRSTSRLRRRKADTVEKICKEKEQRRVQQEGDEVRLSQT